MNKKIKGCLIAAVVVIALVWALFSFMFHTGDPIIEKHLDSVDWLPPAASDISYFERKGFGWIKIYECSIDEIEFLKFAEQNSWQMKEMGDASAHFRNLLGEPPLRIIHDVQVDIVPKALYFEDRKPNGGGVTVIYDKELKRLFYSSSHR